MAISGEAPNESSVSYATGVACLVQLMLFNFLKASGSQLQDGKLPITHMVKLASIMGLRAQHVRLEWQSMMTAIFSSPLLLLLNNTNLILVLGPGPGPAQEVALWDPLNRAGGILSVPREALEEVWDGDALMIGMQQEAKRDPALHELLGSAYDIQIIPNRESAAEIVSGKQDEKTAAVSPRLIIGDEKPMPEEIDPRSEWPVAQRAIARRVEVDNWLSPDSACSSPVSLSSVPNPDHKRRSGLVFVESALRRVRGI